MGGKESLAENYRPVAHTLHLITVFEKCVRDKTIAYMENNNLHSENQHGFRKGRFHLSKLSARFDRLLENLAA